MITSAELLSNFEHCARWGYWSRSWVRRRMTPTQMVHAGVRQSLSGKFSDPGENAGEVIMTLAANRGLDISASHNLYRCAINHACIADLVTTKISQDGGRWFRPDSAEWVTSAFVDAEGTHLRRFLAVTNWNEEREFAEKHSWFCLGEVAHYELPMQLIVAQLGPMSGGRRHGHFSKAMMHPQKSELRFRLRRRSKKEDFGENWIPLFREEHDEISRNKWLECMAKDEVLQQSLFVVDVPVPEGIRCYEIRELARKQLERVNTAKRQPSKQLSTCHNPISPCPFRDCCWSDPESEPEDGGYELRENVPAGPAVT